MSLRAVLPVLLVAAAGLVACSGASSTSSSKSKPGTHSPSAPPEGDGEGDGTDTQDPPITSAPDPSNVTTASDDAGTSTHADAAPPPAKDAGTSTQTECAKLSACCDQIKAAGEDDSICRGVVGMHSESSCKSKHADYQSFGDCT